jgi:predicted NACHT family NTPase
LLFFDSDTPSACGGVVHSPTLNDLMARDGVRIAPDLFVPVGLVERKQKQYQRTDICAAEQGSQLLQPTEEEIVRRFDEPGEFFSQVICDPNISKGSRLVITGEPGAGKTTLLQKIGDRLLQEEMFPIWVSLGKKSIVPTYESVSRILKENAHPQNHESLDWEASVNALLQTGKVWLLLDGADELTANRYPLRLIGEQLREAWADQVTVVLTCRLNAWDTDALPKFTVFRTLEFDYQTPTNGYSNQVEAYIHQFFEKDDVDPQLADSLIQELYKLGKERIRDSVKNPLRLSLLCYVWESGIGKLSTGQKL